MCSNFVKWLCVPAALCTSLTARSQSLFPTTATLDINNIKATAQVHGDIWRDSLYKGCVFPANSGKSLAVAGALWIAGFDSQGQFKAAAQTYRQNGSDYWPGPLGNAGSVNITTSQNWAKIWKINRTDIQAFLSVSNHTQANTPQVILEWPAKNNPYAKGNNNVSLTITADMAPFVDVNGDGDYNALQGDYPAMKGDQMLWWVINDSGPTLHTVTQTTPLEFEIRNMAYGYKRNNVLDDVLFYEYDIINQASVSYDSLRIGFFADVDLRYAFDDYIGFDSSHRMGIAYNGIPAGADSLGIAGVSLVDITGDNCQNHVPAGSFMYYNNDFTPMGNPTNGIEYSNLLSSRFRQGATLPNNARYAFPDDPSLPGGNSECAQNNTPNDRRFVLASPSLHLDAGAHVKLTFALIADGSTQSTCPQISFTHIKGMADSVWKYFCTPPANTGISNVATERKALKLYPNPAQQSIFIETPEPGSNAITVYDVTGKKYNLPFVQKNQRAELDIHTLAPGLYTILCRNGDRQQSGVFLKE